MRCYYRVRDDRFNPVRKRILNGEQSRATYYTPALAAMLIYLNRTGFNGLFRLNSEGSFKSRQVDTRIPRSATPRTYDVLPPLWLGRVSRSFRGFVRPWWIRRIPVILSTLTRPTPP